MNKQNIILKQIEMTGTKAKAFVREKDFVGITAYSWLLDGAPKIEKPEQAFSYNPYGPLMFLDADLHLELNKMVGKQNCMIEGKYKKARLYIFETPHLYLYAVCETGDRGSAWGVVDKETKNKASEFGYYCFDDMMKIAPNKLKELSAYIQYIAWHVLGTSVENKKIATKYYPELLEKLNKKFGLFDMPQLQVGKSIQPKLHL